MIVWAIAGENSPSGYFPTLAFCGPGGGCSVGFRARAGGVGPPDEAVRMQVYLLFIRIFYEAVEELSETIPTLRESSGSMGKNPAGHAPSVSESHEALPDPEPRRGATWR